MTERIEINSVEALVEYAVSRPNSSTRFMLREMISREYDDAEAGAAWDAEKKASDDVFYKLSYEEKYGDNPIGQANKAARDELESRQPSQHMVSHWYLDEETSYRSGLTIWISEELAKMLDAVWTKRPIYPGSKSLDRTGAIMISTMLKRLGQTDIGQRIEAARKLSELKQARNVRNNRRNAVRAKASELIQLLTDYASEIGGLVDATDLLSLSKIATLPNDESEIKAEEVTGEIDFTSIPVGTRVEIDLKSWDGCLPEFKEFDADKNVVVVTWKNSEYRVRAKSVVRILPRY